MSIGRSTRRWSARQGLLDSEPLPPLDVQDRTAECQLNVPGAIVQRARAELRRYINSVFTFVLDVFSLPVVPGMSVYVPIKGLVTALLAANDTLDIRVFQNSGAAKPLSASQTYNYVTIKRHL